MSRNKKGEAINGWVNFDKPCGMTSTKAVAIIRRIYNAQKAGHAGTLDPLASGVLPIALGEATKTVPYLMDADKIYRFTINFSQTTDSFDAEGAVVALSDKRPTKADIQAVLPQFTGEISQVPPAFSAIMVNGQRAYDLAREGVEVELKPRLVDIYQLSFLRTLSKDEVELLVHCGKGTYVRALCRDICAQLGVCGYVTDLRRERVGAFETNFAITLEKLEDLGHRGAQLSALLGVETALDDIPAMALTQEEAQRVRQGRELEPSPHLIARLKDATSNGELSDIIQVFEGGKLLAMCLITEGWVRPTRLFHL